MYEVGTKLYVYSERLGMIEHTISKVEIINNKPKYYTSNTTSNTTFKLLQIEPLSTTKELAIIKFYQKQIVLLEMFRDRARKKLKDIETEIDDLHNKYKHLRNAHPDEFV